MKKFKELHPQINDEWYDWTDEQMEEHSIFLSDAMSKDGIDYTDEIVEINNALEKRKEARLTNEKI